MRCAIIPVNPLKGRFHDLIKHKKQQKHHKRGFLLIAVKPFYQDLSAKQESGTGEHPDHDDRHNKRRSVPEIHRAYCHQKTGYISSLPLFKKLAGLSERSLYGLP